MNVVNLALAALFGSFIVSEASASIVTNGSFETFTGTFSLEDGGAALVPSSTTLTGWTNFFH